MESDAPRYDTLLVLGSTLGQWGTQSWHPRLIPDGPLIQVDINQGAIARCFPVSLGVVADVGRFIDDLAALGEQRAADSGLVAARRAALERLKTETSPFLDPDARESTRAPILPQALMKCVSESLPPGSHVFIDAGNCVGWSLHHLTLEPPTQYHIGLTMAPMGFGVCAVIGGKIGAPHRTCLAIVGDGAFLMHGAEVSTAAQYGVGAIWVILADDDMAMVSQGMNYLHPQTSGWPEAYRLGRADIVQFAAALGADTYPVRTVDEAREALRQAQERAASQRKPQVIVASIDRSEMPPYYPVQTPKP
ncbi:MAG TPA: thiamine pyrophosphate-dependent enzyme [Thermoanaerobaculia bacterium]|jgi:acetolactate synthase-1/2/3 large subunit|nr:thiamine pyrophosphate-dependent enzyme [Thermoanaerobaculia bacterium]